MSAGTLDAKGLDKNATEGEKLDRSGKMETLNRAFKTGVEKTGEYFGNVKQTLGDAFTIVDGRNELGNAVKNYFNEKNERVKTVENLGDGASKTTYYDGKGTAYLDKITDLWKDTSELKLRPDTEIVKENYYAKTDELGRTVQCKISGVQTKETGKAALNKNLWDDSYMPGDERGHIIADILGGPATKENIVPQNQVVNRSSMKRVENKVRKLVDQGHRVDYEVKVNYAGGDARPSSFEPKITVDGKLYDLPAELKKIYNVTDDLKTSQMVKITAKETLWSSHKAGLEQGFLAASLTCAISTVENISACLRGEISAGDAAMNIAKDTGLAGAAAYGVTFISDGVSHLMSASSKTLIASLGQSCVPAAAVTFAISSYESVIDFSKGEIGIDELAYDLGASAVGVAGAFGGGVLAGAALGSVVPGAGTVVGAGVGLVASMVGYAVSSEAYKTVVEMGGEFIEAHADELNTIKNKAESIAHNTIDLAAELGDTAVSEVMTAISNFNTANALPFEVL